MSDFDNFQKIKDIVKYILIGMLILFVLVVIVLNLFQGHNSSKKYLIDSNKILWNKIDNKYYQIDYENADIKGDFTIYNGDKVLKAQRAVYDDGNWKFYSGDKALKAEDFKIAFSKISGVKPVNYTIQDYIDSDEELILELADFSDEADLNLYKISLKKISMDFDNDGQNETLYTMSDFVFGKGERTPYSYMFLVKDGNVIDSLMGENSNVFKIEDVLKINGSINVIVSDNVAVSSNYRTCYRFYGIKKGKIKLLQDCMVKE